MNAVLPVIRTYINNIVHGNRWWLTAPFVTYFIFIVITFITDDYLVGFFLASGLNLLIIRNVKEQSAHRYFASIIISLVLIIVLTAVKLEWFLMDVYSWLLHVFHLNFLLKLCKLCDLHTFF